MEVDEGNTQGGSRKRRHPDSQSVVATKTSYEILASSETPNFEELARQYPAFQQAWNQTRQQQKAKGGSFSSSVTQEFTVALTRALLQAHFDLKLPFLEGDHLCPPVPNRFFYLHWIHQHLLKQIPVRSSWGIDIGAGATCVYPLLAAKFFQCRMVASEVDGEAVKLANSNVAANNLDNMIQVNLVPPSQSQDPNQAPGGPLQRALEALWQSHPQQRVDFVMTNPPFYDPTSTEFTSPRTGDGRSRTAATDSEASYPGGEVGFVTDMIADSLRARDSAVWFSSMLGKKTSWTKLSKLLTHMLGPAHVETTEYGPGQYTRWFVAWTLQQPSSTAPAARVRHESDTFRVTGMNTQEPVNEVASRIVAFCESSPGGWSLATQRGVSTGNGQGVQLAIQETNPPPVSMFVDESERNAEIPKILAETLQGQDNSKLLPKEGHFYIIASVELANATAEGCEVAVQLACYRHSSRGQHAIEKICHAIQGEVCRTNRKWRRIHQRQMQT